MRSEALFRVVEALYQQGVGFFAFVSGPSVSAAYRALRAGAAAGAAVEALREDVALSMAVGAWLCGQRACVVVGEPSAPVLAGAMGRLVGPAGLGIVALVASAPSRPAEAPASGLRQPEVWFEPAGVPCVRLRAGMPQDALTEEIRTRWAGGGPCAFVVESAQEASA